MWRDKVAYLNSSRRGGGLKSSRWGLVKRSGRCSGSNQAVLCLCVCVCVDQGKSGWSELCWCDENTLVSKWARSNRKQIAPKSWKWCKTGVERKSLDFKFGLKKFTNADFVPLSHTDRATKSTAQSGLCRSVRFWSGFAHYKAIFFRPLRWAKI